MLTLTEAFASYNWTGLTVLYASRSATTPGACFRDTVSTDKYQLGFKRTGRTEVEYNGTAYDFAAGTLLYLPKEKQPNLPYTRRFAEGGEGGFLFFDSLFPLPPHPFLHRLRMPEEVFLRFEQLIRRYENGDGAAYMAALYHLLSALAQDGAPGRQAARERLAPALQYLTAHAADAFVDFSVPAALSGMTPEYFRHLFREVFGLPPLQYLRRVRLEKAKTLLAEGMSVGDAAKALGFSSPNYFARFFRQYTGVSPSGFLRGQLR